MVIDAIISLHFINVIIIRTAIVGLLEGSYNVTSVTSAMRFFLFVFFVQDATSGDGYTVSNLLQHMLVGFLEFICVCTLTLLF